MNYQEKIEALIIAKQGTILTADLEKKSHPPELIWPDLLRKGSWKKWEEVCMLRQMRSKTRCMCCKAAILS